MDTDVEMDMDMDMDIDMDVDILVLRTYKKGSWFRRIVSLLYKEDVLSEILKII